MSLNDPRWGNNNQGDDRRGNDPSPPDLEEIWRDLNRRLAGAFNRKGGGQRGNDGGGPPPETTRRQFGGGIGLVVAVLVVLWLASGFYTVDASERGVVLRFGKFREVTGEGLNWRLPFPLETHELVNVSQVRTVEVGYRGSERAKDLREALMLTDDENIINIQFAVQYTVADPEAFLFNNRNPEEAVKQAAETAMREIVGKSQMDFVLYQGREEVANSAARLIQDILNRFQTGIQINKVTMQNAQPPEQVQDAFNDAVKAGQDRERLKNEGEAYANDVIPRARGAAARLREEADGYAARVVARAEGDASRFSQIQAEYARAPEVTRNRMYLDAMQQIFANTSKILVDTKGSGNLLYLPLDKIIQSTGATNGTPVPESTPPAAAAEPAPSAAAAAGVDYRSRDAMRSRDR
ncbi:FtsH protease activity modulator HflK [Uliginosibacterium sp. sgz301328]|uniref:FtsH protease activity modulator HflK n=1 Tax=Uliginosibacterium sp. sgz301328 TaxID=3243764 RepID=UPI00359CD75C